MYHNFGCHVERFSNWLQTAWQNKLLVKHFNDTTLIWLLKAHFKFFFFYDSTIIESDLNLMKAFFLTEVSKVYKQNSNIKIWTPDYTFP